MNLIDRLPPVQGQLTERAPLGQLTWFRTGGPAEVLFEPANEDDLAGFMRDRPRDVKLTILGLGSNVLVRDGGVPGVVVHLGPAFEKISVSGETITAGAAARDVKVAARARDASLTGLEFLRGIPGSIGGALMMNAGAYGDEIADVLVSARRVELDGSVSELSLDDLGFAYRHSKTPRGSIYTSATFKATKGDKQAISARMKEIQKERGLSQPVNTRTGGSTFANPPGQKAWELIDRAGCRGLERGAAQVSEKHCNFLINRGGARSDDLEQLAEIVRRRVYETSGISLHMEIRLLGVRRDDPLSLAADGQREAS
ncbi:MAG: UDP-N-acetylmuramate dehydrogenase [Magnetovibrionaceae bacterium]